MAGRDQLEPDPALEVALEREDGDLLAVRGTHAGRVPGRPPAAQGPWARRSATRGEGRVDRGAGGQHHDGARLWDVRGVEVDLPRVPRRRQVVLGGVSVQRLER